MSIMRRSLTEVISLKAAKHIEIIYYLLSGAVAEHMTLSVVPWWGSYLQDSKLLMSIT